MKYVLIKGSAFENMPILPPENLKKDAFIFKKEI